MKKPLFLFLILTSQIFFAQQYWSTNLAVKSDGITEIGKYIDFHESSNDPNDFSVRLSSIDNILNSSSSLLISGTNLDNKNLSYLANSRSLLIGWNRNAGDGETSFITNRGAGSTGGFEFRDIDNSGNETLLFKIVGNGNIGIGTANPGSWKLAVNGNIRAKEIKVETGWPDFVFYDDYKLPTLQEVENHIKEKGHLKDIPSAREVEENGILLGEMDSKLLLKIEELTLYTIQQEKKIQKLERENKELKSLSDRLTEIEKLFKSKQ
ncbi:hypothetical protein [Ascidiimonas aurantiaca]|uniref:hypothetical protein n=1 Tax=Ascidiimonas aurantiaca TaxID=1685432 RepID=UPI0030EBC31D